jgi:hypothetical protein
MPSSKAVRPPWWLKPANKVFIQMSRLGMSFDGREYVVAGFPGADWVANVRAAGQATVARGRRVQRAFPTEVPTGVGFMKRVGLVSEGWPEEFEALAGRCAVFRLEPV